MSIDPDRPHLSLLLLAAARLDDAEDALSCALDAVEQIDPEADLCDSIALHISEVSVTSRVLARRINDGSR